MTEPEGVRHLLLFGTLRRDQPQHARFGLARRLRFVKLVRLKGRMYDLGAYPGAVLAGPGRIVAELHVITDGGLLAELDVYEGPLFERQVVETSGVRAFIYVFIGEPGGAPVVRSGDWLAYASNSRPRPV